MSSSSLPNLAHMADLIPGLPDDLARECLLRVPPDRFPTVASVCGNWEMELRSSLFHRLRKAAGLTTHFIALVLFTGFPSFPAKTNPGVPSYYFALFDPATATWVTLLPFPDLHLRLPQLACIVTVGRELVVIGGWDPQTWTYSDRVHIYDLATAAWRQGAQMPGPRRCFFACAASAEAGLVFVAGGHDSNNRPLRSALAYDVAADAWFPLPDMAMEQACCRGIFSRGVFHVIGGTQPTEAANGELLRNLEAFNVRSWRWEGFREETLKAAGGDGERCKVQPGWEVVVAPSDDDAEGEWRIVGEVPKEVRVELHEAACGWSILLLGSEKYGEQRTGYVADVAPTKGETITWRKVKVPSELSSCYVHGCCNIEI